MDGRCLKEKEEILKDRQRLCVARVIDSGRGDIIGHVRRAQTQNFGPGQAQVEPRF